MSSGQKLQIGQSQSLVMTPQLQQSLKILQYSTQELLTYIESELEQNPMLSEGADEQSVDADKVENEKSDKVQDVLDHTTGDDFASVGDSEKLDMDHENNWDTKENSSTVDASDSYGSEGLSLDIPNSSGRMDFDDSSTSMDQNLAGSKSLRDHLMGQLTVSFDRVEDRIIASHLVDLLDDSGYLTKDTRHLEKVLDCTEDDILDVIMNLQGLDPVGVFARDLAECLKIQLIDIDRLDPAMEKLVNNLELCAKGEFKKLKKICDVDQEDLVDMLSEIKMLNPKPGSDFEVDVVQTLIPDIFVRRNPIKKEWVIELNNEALPKILVNRKYYSEVKKKVSGESDKKYLSEQMNTANWLVKTLNQRAETILKVATELVSQQNDFFEKGIKYLKPMVLSDIAEAIEMHESTVGRVTTNKYIMTPRGTYELKFFFSSSLGDTSGDGESSSRTVKYRIKELIDKESGDAVLSDEKIVQFLKDEGVEIARRTVAKYREQMGIPTSSQRKRQARIQGVK